MINEVPPSLLHLFAVFLLCQDDDKEYSGPSPADLLEPLFKRSSCSYRVRLCKFHSHLISLPSLRETETVTL